jgi:hypothetical protein
MHTTSKGSHERRAGTHRLGRMAAIAAVAVTAGLVASAAPAGAAEDRPPSAGAGALASTCYTLTDTARTYFGVRCTSSWPWDDFVYYSWVRCTNNMTYYGLAYSSFWDGDWSWAQCPWGTYTVAGYIPG